ncbi:MAG: threonine--tRNA ligase [SAR324 cluster bacterium]|nr:threonine--tRNA ligase [SAR324 cluster bacterium]
MEKLDQNTHLYKIRHSLAHVLAQSVLELRPNAKLGFGPPTSTGFYYDFDLEEALTPEDLKVLEKKMKKIIKSNQKFHREELSFDDLKQRLEESDQTYKIEWADELSTEGEAVWSVYNNGPFWDMCEGPHIESTKDIPLNGFSLDSLAGAYWRGSEENKMMQRVYGLAFEDGEQLQDFKKKRKLAMERDHRKLNAQMQFFIIEEEVGKGLPLWLPNGTILRDELEKLAKEKEFAAGYQRVATPHITKENLYLTSGHLPHYAESMFPPMDVDGEKMYLKPMNCPHHHLIYRSSPRSYRELPLRLAEYGMCYRYEQSGELAGLLRVRGLSMNDAHIYCTPEQTKEEFINVIQMHLEYYQMFGLADYWMRLSLPDEDNKKFVSDPELWKRACDLVVQAMDEVGVHYEAVEGEAAFYGPKIDFQIVNVVGREETASTNQLDLIMAERFDLYYIGADNEHHRPFIIHRAPLGTHERFCAFLIEHYGGAFPTWLAPVQVRILPVASAFYDYAFQLKNQLQTKFIRVEVDDSHDKFGKKIRNGATSKIPNLLILGEKEQSDQSVTWKRYGDQDQQTLSFESFQSIIVEKINSRLD